jgi:hypothetical protein
MMRGRSVTTGASSKKKLDGLSRPGVDINNPRPLPAFVGNEGVSHPADLAGQVIVKENRAVLVDPYIHIREALPEDSLKAGDLTALMLPDAVSFQARGPEIVIPLPEEIEAVNCLLRDAHTLPR